MKKFHLTVTAILAVVLITMTFRHSALHSQPYRQRVVKSLPDSLMQSTKLSKKQTDVVLKEIGPAIREQLSAGRQVRIQGLGTFRLVRIAQHRELVQGRPVIIPASNYVEFVPIEGVVAAVNGSNAVPSVQVPAFQYIPIPGRAPSRRTGSTRMPNVRTR